MDGSLKGGEEGGIDDEEKEEDEEEDNDVWPCTTADDSGDDSDGKDGDGDDNDECEWGKVVAVLLHTTGVSNVTILDPRTGSDL